MSFVPKPWRMGKMQLLLQVLISLQLEHHLPHVSVLLVWFLIAWCVKKIKGFVFKCILKHLGINDIMCGICLKIPQPKKKEEEQVKSLGWKSWQV